MTNSTTSVIVFPLALGVLLLAMQWAMVSWATATAHSAAQEAARAAAIYDSSATAAETTAHDAINPAVLSSPTITVTRDTTLTAVTVTGSAVQVVPGWPTTITVTATAPIERLTQP